MSLRTWTYGESIACMEELYLQPLVPARKAGLRRIERLLLECGNPHRTFHSVHIAGTTGKGSTTTMIGSILRESGYRTGLFLSPHLDNYRERISVDGSDIEPEQWEACFGAVWPVVEAMSTNRMLSYDLGRPSFFEVMFAMACVFFERQEVDWAAIETGLGGRLDATNTLSSKVSVITNVSLEHTQVLGNTVEAITREKAAIIKPLTTAILGEASAEVAHVVRARAHDMGSQLFEVGRDLSYNVLDEDNESQTVRFRGRGIQLRATLHLAGRFQATNAAAAVSTALALRSQGVPIAGEHIARGLENSRMPGRFETISRDPLIIVDGAHNPAGMSAATQALRRSLPSTRLILVFAAMVDKDVESMARTLAPLVDITILTRAPGSHRSAEPANLARFFQSTGGRVHEVGDASQALDQAIEMVDNCSGIFVAGSLYLVGFARTHFQRLGLLQ